MTVSLFDKLISILLYIIPLAEALPFGSSLFTQYPFMKIIIIASLPIILIEQALPFGSLLLFFILFIGVIRNTKLSYFLRFNALQSILLNIALILTNLIFQGLLNEFSHTLIIRTISSTILISTIAIVTFSIYECILGKEPQIPGFSNAARMQL